jgi:hypothetical protein
VTVVPVTKLRVELWVNTNAKKDWVNLHKFLNQEVQELECVIYF